MKKLLMLMVVLSLTVFSFGIAQAVDCTDQGPNAGTTSNLVAEFLDTPTLNGYYIVGKAQLKEVICCPTCRCDTNGWVEIILSTQAAGSCQAGPFTYSALTDRIVKMIDVNSELPSSGLVVQYADPRGFPAKSSIFPSCGLKNMTITIPVKGLLGIGSGQYHVYIVWNNGAGVREVMACGGNI